MVVFLALVFIGIEFLCTAGLVWLLCWLLPMIGITAIGSIAVVFSWKLVLVVWLIIVLLRSIFHISVKS